MAKPLYGGKKDVREKRVPKTYRKLESIGDLDSAICYLHGGRYLKAICPGCIGNDEADRDHDGMLEALEGGDF
jgi:hypothetical protein